MKVALKKQATSLGLRINIKDTVLGLRKQCNEEIDYKLINSQESPTGSLKSRRKDEW